MGISALVFGSLWLLRLVSPLIRILDYEGNDFGIIVFGLVMIPFLSAPGLLAVFFGFRLTRLPTKINIGGAIGSQLLMLIIVTSSLITDLALFWMSEKFAFDLALLLTSAVATPMYVYLCRVAMRSENMPLSSGLGTLAKPPALFLTYQVYSVSDALFEIYTPIKEGSQYLPQEPWGIVGLVVPLLLAWGFYKLFMRFFTRQSSSGRGSGELSVNPTTG